MIGKQQKSQNSVCMVTNLKYSAKEYDLMDLLKNNGFEPIRARLLMDAEGNSRGTGFVEMKSEGDARAVIEKLNGYNFQGRNLKVSLADNKR